MTTDSNPGTNSDRIEYEPWNDHYCDGHIDYDDDTITIDLDTADRTVELTGTCVTCGREMTVIMGVELPMLKTIDTNTGTVLHEY